jgi:glutamate/tyrosine decarboxylase-like PLP-dependent enzyme
VARHYQHDSPYTYFSSEDLHLGEISLECSRAGAAAAAFWFTIQVLPLTTEGLGESLRVNRAGALEWAELLQSSEKLELYQQPELDILAYYPKRQSLTEVTSASKQLFADAASTERQSQIHLATYSVTADAFQKRKSGLELDAETATIVRSTLMKPESASIVAQLHGALEELI